VLTRTAITSVALFTALCLTPRAAADPTASGEALAPAQSAAQARTAPLPGAAAALRRLSDGIARGEPDYNQLTPDFGKVVRDHLPDDRPSLAPLGPIQSVRFRGPTAQGGDRFEVRYAKSVQIWMIILTAEGKVAGASWGDVVAPNVWWRGYYDHARTVSLPDRRHMRLYCEGAGSPAVILDAGLGGDASNWRTVQDQIARATLVCSYDRAGLGGSDPGPMPRDAAARVSDLKQMLAAAKVHGPYVLVGHSLGSYDDQLFADLFRRDVAGMVLVDPAIAPKGLKTVPPPPSPILECMKLGASGQVRPGSPAYAQCVGDAPPDMPGDLVARYVEDRAKPAAWSAWEGEADALLLDLEEVRSHRQLLGDMPLLVLTHGGADRPPGASTEQLANDASNIYAQHQEIVVLSSRGEHRVVPNAHHYIQFDAPQVVVDAVDEVVSTIRRQ
jgi:pimeloyl-ACP methyl ester carboxylesterase